MVAGLAAAGGLAALALASHPAAGKGMQDGRPTAYVCRGPTCSLPITAADELAQALAP